MPRLRSKRSAPIRGTSQVEAERLRNELQLRPAAVKVDTAIGANAGLTASSISGFNTSVDGRITAAVGSTVQAYSATLSAWAGIATSEKQNTIVAGAAIADVSGGATVDAEARAALNSLLATLRTQGLLTT
jgi:hypothetical protein